MPIFECTAEGQEKPRMVRATSAALARRHIITAKAISADRMADLLGEGVTIEIYSADGDDEPETPPVAPAAPDPAPEPAKGRRSKVEEPVE